MDADARIAQFEDLVRENPMDDMAYFGLAGAYAQAGRQQDAATSYERVIALNPDNSRAYQLAAEQYTALGKPDKALPLMEQGLEVATLRGDMMPKNAILDLYKRLGKEPPEVKAEPEDIPEGAFVCKKTGRPGHQMERPPFKGPIGEWIQQNISAETWNAWLHQGTKVINELRLDLSRDQDEAQYDKYMRDYLGITDDLHEELTGQRP